MDIKVIMALIGLGGVFSSVLVQFWLGSRTEKKKSISKYGVQPI